MPAHKRLKGINDEEIIALFHGGMNMKTIGQQLAIHEKTVGRILRQNKVDVDSVKRRQQQEKWLALPNVQPDINPFSDPYKGIDYIGSKWRARIMVNGKSVTLGRYATPEEAHAKYCEAKAKRRAEHPVE